MAEVNNRVARDATKRVSLADTGGKVKSSQYTLVCCMAQWLYG